jgi:hypothetical protein
MGKGGSTGGRGGGAERAVRDSQDGRAGRSVIHPGAVGLTHLQVAAQVVRTQVARVPAPAVVAAAAALVVVVAVTVAAVVKGARVDKSAPQRVSANVSSTVSPTKTVELDRVIHSGALTLLCQRPAVPRRSPKLDHSDQLRRSNRRQLLA